MRPVRNVLQTRQERHGHFSTNQFLAFPKRNE